LDDELCSISVLRSSLSGDEIEAELRLAVQEIKMKLSASNIATAAITVCLIPAFHLGAQAAPAASHDSNGQNSNTPKVELFVGYSYLRAVPTLTDGKRLVFLNGVSTSIAYNFNRYLGIVGDFGGFDDSQFQATGVGNPPNAINSSGNVFTYQGGR
jgi:hypothetical protein